MATIKCDKCSTLGLTFYADNIFPYEYLEGRNTADIWIVGLNPKGEIGCIDKRTLEDFESFDPDCHPYFHDFKKVSQKIYANWKSEKGRIAHTDLVKCSSQSFPPTAKRKDKEQIIDNCKVHLLQQIKTYKPKIIICNGSDVCIEMIKFFPPDTTKSLDILTSYKISFEKNSFWVILSGFIGRIDDRNKRRLGKEIEKIAEEEGIEL
jgi:hypothetical protein